MALKKEKKQQIIQDLSQNIDNQKIMIFTGFKGIKNKDLLDLRNSLKSASANLVVAKKTLMQLSFDRKKINIDKEVLKNEAAVIFGFQDQIEPARIIFDFSKKNPELKIIGGVLDNVFREAEDIIELAKIPSKQELLAKFVGTIQAPVTGFASVLQGNIKGLLTVLSKIKTN